MFVTGTWLLCTCTSSDIAMQHDIVYTWRDMHTRNEQRMQSSGSWQPLHMILSFGLPTTSSSVSCILVCLSLCPECALVVKACMFPAM